MHSQFLASCLFRALQSPSIGIVGALRRLTKIKVTDLDFACAMIACSTWDLTLATGHAYDTTDWYWDLNSQACIGNLTDELAMTMAVYDLSAPGTGEDA